MANLVDRIVGVFNPQAAMRREIVRAMYGSERYKKTLENVSSGGYWGNGRKDRSLGQWVTQDDDINTVLSGNLAQLRNDSNDLMANNPLAVGAVGTKVINVVGPELRPQVVIDHKLAGISKEAAEQFGRAAEAEWDLFSANADVTRTMSMGELQALAYTAPLIDGDLFVSLPVVSRTGVLYETAVNFIQGHRVSNPDNGQDTDRLIMGVEFDVQGAPKYYHYSTQHPGSGVGTLKKVTWERLKVFDRNGVRQVFHIYKKIRVNQARGVPVFAPIIKSLKLLDTWSQATINNAVISSFFTVFLKSNAPGDALLDAVTYLGDETGASATDKDVKLASGNIVRLFGDEDVKFADPRQPNENFEPFFRAVTTQIAIALDMPAEVLLKTFNASYSASRGALLEAVKHFNVERAWIVRSFCQPLYEAMLFEAVAKGWLQAPGFLDDPRVQRAYCACLWTGPGQGSLNPLDEARAREIDIRTRVTSANIEAASMGRDVENIIADQGRVRKLEEGAGLISDLVQNLGTEQESQVQRDTKDQQAQRDAKAQQGVKTPRAGKRQKAKE